MLELGIPNHAYDLARVPRGHLRVRRARQGESVTTLDGVERAVSPGDGLICDAGDRPIGLAGVMGGLDTEIGAGTVDVLLEAAWWDAPSITRTSRRLRLYSEASGRFARGTDPEMIPTAIARFAELLAPGGTTLDRGLVDERGGLALPPTVRVRTARVNAVLGIALSDDDIRAELEPIGFACVPTAEGFDVTIPTWRPDSALEIDVIEEVARHHGYPRIGRTVPRSPDPGSLTPRQRDRHTVRDTLIGLGLDEAMPMPFLAPDDNLRAGLRDDRPIALLNPLDARESVLRTSLLPGLLKAVAYNGSHRNAGVRLFEIGHVYLPPPDGAELPDEREHVAAALAGTDAGDAKLALDTLMDTLAVEGYRLVAADDLPGLHPTRGARVLAGDVEVGVVGEVDPGVLAAYEVDERLGWFELNLDRVLDLPHGLTAYRPVSRFPSSDVDLAFIVDDAVPAATVEATLRAAGSPELAGLRLFDVYRGAQTGEGRRSLAFTLRFQAPDRTLTDDEVGTIRQRCIDAVETAHGATLR
jgi:phenylalanyl-tRNA synthetase beta chain